MSSFISDDRGIIEPYADLPAMALAVVGFIVFIAIISGAYSAYEEKSFIAGHYQDARNLAEKIARDRILTGTRPGMMESGKLETIKKDPAEIFQKYGSYYNFMLKVDSNSENRAYSVIIKNPDFGESKTGISASIPVIVKLNDLVEQPGTLTVKIWSK